MWAKMLDVVLITPVSGSGVTSNIETIPFLQFKIESPKSILALFNSVSKP